MEEFSVRMRGGRDIYPSPGDCRIRHRPSGRCWLATVLVFASEFARMVNNHSHYREHLTEVSVTNQTAAFLREKASPCLTERLLRSELGPYSIFQFLFCRINVFG